jgi:ribosomal protein S24E
MFFAGVSQTDITPPTGNFLIGHRGRNKPSERVHDPLKAKALSIYDGKKRVIVITSDLIYFPFEYAGEVKEEIKKVTGLEEDQIYLTASHTHTGPGISRNANYFYAEHVVPEYLYILKRKIAGCASEAIQNEKESELFWGEGSVDIGTVNRRKKTSDGMAMAPDWDKLVDNDVSLIKVIQDEKVVAVLFHYTCHPTTIGTTIYEISADYPGVAQRVLEKNYPGAIALFMNGCCGDIRPAIVDEKRERFRGGDFSDVERMGTILAYEVAKEMERAVPVGGGVKYNLVDFNLPLEEKLIPQNKDDVQKFADKYIKEKYSSEEVVNLWRKNVLEKIDKEKFEPYVPCQLHAVKIGNVKFAGFPGETMVGIGLRVKDSSGRKTFTTSFTNGEVAYLPTRDALEEGGYEAVSFLYQNIAAPFAKNFEDNIVTAMVKGLEL